MELKGKQLTLGAKVLAGVFVLIAFALLGFGIFDANSVKTTDILLVGLFLAFIFGPVDVSLVLKTFMENLPSQRFVSGELTSRLSPRSEENSLVNHDKEKPEDTP